MVKFGKTWADSVSAHTTGSKLRRQEAERKFVRGGWQMGALRVLVVGLFLMLLAVLFRIQIYQGDYYRGLSDGNRLREVPIFASRGIIYDRNGKPLVANLPAFRLQECQYGSKCQARIISKDQAISLEVGPDQTKQSLLVDASRSYLYAEATAHLLGYVSEVTQTEMAKNQDYILGDRIGRGGIEEEDENILSGTPGRELVEVDAMGRKLRTLTTELPVPGQDLTLNVDLDLQKGAYLEVANRRAAVVVTNPQTGAVLALVSSPSFDPNVFTDLSMVPADREAKIDSLFNNSSQPLFDRAITGTYPSGSTFKIVTATAGLELGKITADFTIDDPGILVIGPYKFPNWKFLQDGGTQGVLNVVSAIKVSNDIFFYKVGELVGVDGLADWALKYGLSKPLGIDLPGESGGVFPTKAWRDKFTRSWYLGDTYHLAIGQGDLLVTPLQVNRWTSVIANGGKLCRPEVLAGQKPDCRDLGISQKTISLIRQGMEEACAPGGTSWPLFHFKNPKDPSQEIKLACKTGTAEFGDPSGKTHAWLTAYAPADNPQIAVTVLIEGGGEGSDVAAPVVKKILETWFGR